jgi:hypothetical protein
MTSYWEKLKDPRWQKMRLEVLQRDEFTCVRCGAKDKTLHVHHGYYEKGKDPWDYYDWTLYTLCEDCHLHVKAVMESIAFELARICPSDLDDVSDLIGRVSFTLMHHKQYRFESLGPVIKRLSEMMGVQVSFIAPERRDEEATGEGPPP